VQALPSAKLRQAEKTFHAGADRAVRKAEQSEAERYRKMNLPYGKHPGKTIGAYNLREIKS
jgi:hypothetical protein